MDEKLIQEVQAKSGAIDADLLKRLIEGHVADAAMLKQSYEHYKGNVSILDRTLSDSNKINEKLANDYAGYIVDQFCGYFMGNPVVYGFNKNNYNDAQQDLISEELRLFGIRSNIADNDAELNRFVSICGKAYRLLYIDTEGHERAVDLRPWEVVYIPTLDGTSALVVVRYRKRWTSAEIITAIDIYTATEKQSWTSSKSSYVAGDVSKHMFDEVPIFEFAANVEKQNDFNKVLSLIDAYDLSFSDCQNEVEEFRLAYMIFVGCKPTAEVIKAARLTGAFEVPENCSATFLTKELPEKFIGAHFKRLNENILKFAKAIDMTDDKFSGGAQSGESRKWKLLALENKAIGRERKFIASFRIQFRCLSTAWGKKKIPLIYEDMNFQFVRNIPVEIASSAEIAQNLLGIVSKETLLSLLPFVDDVEAELLRQADEGISLEEEGPESE